MNKFFLVIIAAIIATNFLGAQAFAQKVPKLPKLPIEGKRLQAARDESGAILNGKHRSTIIRTNGEQLTGEVTYLDGFENGLMTVTDQSNRLRYEIPFEKGAINGLVKGFGTVKGHGLTWETHYLNGEKHGFHRIYYNKGLYFEASYEDGDPHGPEKEFYNNGQLYSEVNIVHGRREGYQRYYKPDGSLESEVYFEKGIKKKK